MLRPTFFWSTSLFLVSAAIFFILHEATAASVFQTVTVKNNPPQVEEVIIADSPSGIGLQNFSLREGSTATMYIRGFASDPDSCIDIDSPTSWKIVAYRSDLPEGETCLPDQVNCYPVDITSSVLLSGCTEPADTTIEYMASIVFQYTANPTDTSSPHAATDWTMYIQITDEAQQAEVAHKTTFEMDSLIAFTVTPSVNYGRLPRGEDSSPQPVVFANTGNREINIRHFFLTNFHCSGLGSADIPASNVTLTQNSPSGPSVGDHFSLLDTQTIYFRLHMPESGVSGDCTNTIKFQAVAP